MLHSNSKLPRNNRTNPLQHNRKQVRRYRGRRQRNIKTAVPDWNLSSFKSKEVFLKPDNFFPREKLQLHQKSPDRECSATTSANAALTPGLEDCVILKMDYCNCLLIFENPLLCKTSSPSSIRHPSLKEKSFEQNESEASMCLCVSKQLLIGLLIGSLHRAQWMSFFLLQLAV